MFFSVLFFAFLHDYKRRIDFFSPCLFRAKANTLNILMLAVASNSSCYHVAVCECVIVTPKPLTDLRTHKLQFLLLFISLFSPFSSHPVRLRSEIIYALRKCKCFVQVDTCSTHAVVSLPQFAAPKGEFVSTHVSRLILRPIHVTHKVSMFLLMCN